MTKDQLKPEINLKNRQIEVVEITKFGSYTHLFKMELQTIEQAQHVLAEWIPLLQYQNS